MGSGIRSGGVGTGHTVADMVYDPPILPDVEVVDVALGDTERARRFGAGCGSGGASTTIAELVSRPDVEAIYVANCSADDVAAMGAVAAGETTLIEKPIVLSHVEAADLIAETRAQTYLLAKSLWSLTLPDNRDLAVRLGSGDYREAVRLIFDIGYPMDRQSYLALDGRVLHDRAIYGASLALSLRGPAQQLQASVLSDDNELDMAAALQVLNGWLLAPHATQACVGADPDRSMPRHFCEFVRSARTESTLIPPDLSFETIPQVDAARKAGFGSVESDA